MRRAAARTAANWSPYDSTCRCLNEGTLLVRGLIGSPKRYGLRIGLFLEGRKAAEAFSAPLRSLGQMRSFQTSERMGGNAITVVLGSGMLVMNPVIGICKCMTICRYIPDIGCVLH